MRDAALSFTEGVRPAGKGTRGPALLVLLAVAIAYSAESGDFVCGALFIVLLLLPRTSFLFRIVRSWQPTVAFGLFGVLLLVPVLLTFAGRSPAGVAAGRIGMLLAVRAWQQSKLTVRDHRFLLLVGLLVVLMGVTAPGPKYPVPLVLYGIAGVVGLFRLHMAAEEQRVLDLARVKGFLRDDAGEVGGRTGFGRAYRTMTSVALSIVVAGALLAWLTPRVAKKIEGLLSSGQSGGESTASALPEAGSGPPPFAIPPGVRALPPFGLRLDRGEFVHRLESTDSLAFLLRRKDGRKEFGTGLLVDAESYDFLTSDGRWIRSHPEEEKFFDAEDGARDGMLTFGTGSRGKPVAREVLRPPGAGGVVAAVAPLFRLAGRSVLRDGVGNLRFVSRDRYVAFSGESPSGKGAILADPGPEFFLLPAGVDREALRERLRPVLVSTSSVRERIEAVRSWLMNRAVHWESDAPPPGQAALPKEARRKFDFQGFLDRWRWGRNVDFATAFAMLLRAADVPCRFVAGYHEGAAIRDADFRVFRSGHLYAFVEVPFVGRGWVPFDATPPALNGLALERLKRIFEKSPDQRAAAARSPEKKAGTGSLGKLINFILDRIDRLVSSHLSGSPSSSGTGRFVAILVLVLLFFLLLFGVVALGRGGYRAVRRLREGRTGGGVDLLFYDRLLSVLARHGYRRRRNQTPLEFARMVVRALGPVSADVPRLTNAFCACRYGFRSLSFERRAEYFERVGRLELALQDLRRNRHGARTTAVVTGALVLLLGGASVLRAAGPAAKDFSALSSTNAAERAAAEKAIEKAGQASVPKLLEILLPPEASSGAARIAKLVDELDSAVYAEREKATKALQRLGRPAVLALRKAATTGSPEVRRRARKLLAKIGEGRGEDPARAEERVRIGKREALFLLGRVGSGSEGAPIVAAVRENPELREEGIEALAAIGKREPAALAGLLDRAEAAARLLVVKALGKTESPLVRPRLLALLDDPDPAIRRAARRALLSPALVEDVDRARLLVTDRKSKKAKRILRRVLLAVPGYGEAGRLLARILYDTARYKEGVELVDGLDLPDAQREMLAARFLVAEGDREGALARLFDAAQAAPLDPEPFLLTADLDLGAEPPRRGDAIEALRAAAKRDPTDAKIFARLGRVLERVGDLRQAKAAYRKALQLDPGNEDYSKALSRRR